MILSQLLRHDFGNLDGLTFSPIDFYHMPRNIAGGHATGVHGDDLVVKTGEACFAFG